MLATPYTVDYQLFAFMILWLAAVAHYCNPAPCQSATLLDWWSGSSGKSTCIATVKPWVQTPVPPKTKQNKTKKPNILLFLNNILLYWITYCNEVWKDQKIKLQACSDKLGYSSVVENLPSLLKALSLIPSTTKNFLEVLFLLNAFHFCFVFWFFLVLMFELRAYTLNQSPALFFFFCDGFFERSFYWPGLALNHNPPDLCLLSS
jgi:hypothetical protein